MQTESTKPASIDEYIAAFPPEIRQILDTLRQTIRQAVPDAGETISYGMPTFTLHGNLVHFAAFQAHIGFYPAPSGIEEFRQELAAYPGSKGAIRFPLDRPIPYDLVRRITLFRAEENRRKAAAKKRRA